MPKVSIISAVYNVEKYLNRCLDSVINQTLKDIEIILINDCSTDNSLKIMQEYAQKDERIKIIDLKENSGAAVARNKGLEIATGEYLGFIDPDDAIDLNFYEELYNAAKKQNADLAKCVNKIINTDGTSYISKFNQTFANNKYKFMIEWTTAIYKREIIDKYNINFPPECRKGQDSAFQIRFIFKSKNIAIIDNVLYYYYRREGSLHSNNIPPKNIKSALTAISYMLKEANNSELYDISKEKYLEVFKIYYNAMFYTLFQSKEYESKKYCAHALIEQFYNCKCSEEFKKIYLYKWILKYIENKNVNGLAKALKQYSCEKELKKEPKKWYKFIFSSENDINKKGRKIIYFLGIKCSFKVKSKVG